MFNAEQMDYQGAIFRPPSEAGSIILQATVGCSHNRCSFCPSYKEKRFQIKERALVMADLRKAARLYPCVKRLFVADGDALIMPIAHWRWLLPAIKEQLPWIERVGVYATGRAIRKKTDAELAWLRQNGLGIVYLGVESGDDATLACIGKDSSAEQLLTAGRRVKSSGIALSVTVLLGTAPIGRSLEHGRQTGLLLSSMDPDFVGALSVIVSPGTELAELVALGTHQVPGPLDLLRELREMLRGTDLSRGMFMANHASNYLPLKVKMPEEKESALELLDAAINGQVTLRSEAFRAL